MTEQLNLFRCLVGNIQRTLTRISSGHHHHGGEGDKRRDERYHAVERERAQRRRIPLQPIGRVGGTTAHKVAPKRPARFGFTTRAGDRSRAIPGRVAIRTVACALGRSRASASSCAAGMTVKRLLAKYGWSLTDAHAFTADPWAYRDYIRASRGELNVTKDQNVRLRSGWFSDLAVGRPVVTQDTGFGTVLPTGRGLSAFDSIDDAVSTIETINGDYERHSRAAREIARDYFRAETVSAKVLKDLGLQS